MVYVINAAAEGPMEFSLWRDWGAGCKSLRFPNVVLWLRLFVLLTAHRSHLIEQASPHTYS
jgi:hypothetical protein